MPFGEGAALAAAASWAVGSLLFARIGKRVAPGAMNLGKCVAAAVLLSLVRAALTPSLGGVRWPEGALVPLAISGLVGLTIGDTAYFGAIVTLGVPRAILLLSGAPVFATVGGVLFLGEKVGAREAVGIGLTLAGIALVVLGRSDSWNRVAAPAPSPSQEGAATSALSPPDGGAGGGDPSQSAGHAQSTLRKGILLGVIAALCQAGGSLLSRKAMALGIDPLAAAAGRLVSGAAGLVIAAAIAGHLRPWTRDLRKDLAWAKVAAASLVGTFGGIWLSQLALAHCTSTGVASTLLATSPIFALPLAHFVGHERITARGIAGTGIALAGVVLLSLR